MFVNEIGEAEDAVAQFRQQWAVGLEQAGLEERPQAPVEAGGVEEGRFVQRFLLSGFHAQSGLGERPAFDLARFGRGGGDAAVVVRPI